MAETVLGILVLTKSRGQGALARSLWQGLVCVNRGELVLGWWCATREGVVSGWGAVE